MAAPATELGVLSGLCQAVYGEIAGAHRLVCAETDASGYVVADQTRAPIVAFRGTDSLRDIRFTVWTRRTCLEPVGIVPRETAGRWCWTGLCDCSKAHTGFLAQYCSLRAEMFAALDGASLVTTTGHSMGGALAVLAAVDAAEAGARVECTTFGAPRVGNAAFAARYQAAVADAKRIVHVADIVPTVPIAPWYRHVIGPTVVGGEGAIGGCATRWLGFIAYAMRNSLARHPHSMDEYARVSATNDRFAK